MLNQKVIELHYKCPSNQELSIQLQNLRHLRDGSQAYYDIWPNKALLQACQTQWQVKDRNLK